MGKYENLGAFLQKQRAREVPLTFREIEKITGVKLPPKAQHHRAWWSNNPSNNVMTKVWLEAGYESAQVDMEARKLVFRRVVKASEASGGFAEAAAEAIRHQGRPPPGPRRVEGDGPHSARSRSDRAGRSRVGRSGGQEVWTGSAVTDVAASPRHARGDLAIRGRSRWRRRRCPPLKPHIATTRPLLVSPITAWEIGQLVSRNRIEPQRNTTSLVRACTRDTRDAAR